MKSLLLVPALAGLALLASVKDCKDRVCPRGMTLDPQAQTCVCREGLVPAPDGVGCVMPAPPSPPPPEPSPTAEPTPEPTPTLSPPASPEPEPSTLPGPSPSSGPTPAATPGPPCPAVVAIAANVAQHQAPNHQTWPHPWGLVGGTTNLDSTVKFQRDCPVCACDSDHHKPCTFDGNTHIHTLVPAPTPENPDRMVCVTYRHCEDRRGSRWEQMGGPSVRFSVENGDEGRGYGLNIGPFIEPGNYSFRVCVPQDWLDEEGYSVPVQSGACREVSFEVR